MGCSRDTSFSYFLHFLHAHKHKRKKKYFLYFTRNKLYWCLMPQLKTTYPSRPLSPACSGEAPQVPAAPTLIPMLPEPCKRGRSFLLNFNHKLSDYSSSALILHFLQNFFVSCAEAWMVGRIICCVEVFEIRFHVLVHVLCLDFVTQGVRIREKQSCF